MMNYKVSEKTIQELAPQKFGWRGKLWTGVLMILFVSGLGFYFLQLKDGLVITGMRDYTSWGIYISNFVFFVAISLVGSLISAILKLTNAKWRTPLTRISEMIAVSAIIFAGIIIIVDMGRPDRIHHLFLYGRLQSPIIWDVIVITTYIFISLLLLYLPLVPDLALLKDRADLLSKPMQKIYRFLSINWIGESRQRRKMERSIAILVVMIIPVAFGIHTVTSWLFATTFRPGWDSTNFGPYFVSGAFMVGAAAVILAMYIFRKFYGLEHYFTNQHFDYMGKLLVLLSLVYLYFNVNEYLVPSYKMKSLESGHLEALFTGSYAPLFWSVQLLGMLVPVLVLLFRKGRSPLPMFLVSLLVIIGAWFKRFLIVVPTLAHPLIPVDRAPEDWVTYMPTLAEWSITLGSLAGALLIVTFMVRYFPIIPIVETLEEQEEQNAEELKFHKPSPKKAKV